MAAATGRTDVSAKRRWLLEIVLALLGIQAFYGGFQLIRDAFAFPIDWLDPLPFDSWVIPGFLLMALIGVPAFALLGMYVAQNAAADRLTIAFGFGVMLWIVVQLFFVPLTFLQPLVFVLGLVLVLVAWSRTRSAD